MNAIHERVDGLDRRLEMGTPSKPVTSLLVGVSGVTIALAAVATHIQSAAISESSTPAYVKLSFLGLSILAGTLWLGRGLIVRRQMLVISAVVLLVAVVSGTGVALGIEGATFYSVLLGPGVLASVCD